MATAASSPPPRPPRRISLAEEALVLPGRNARLFAPVSLLILAHTFLSLSVAVLRVPPLAAVIADALRNAEEVWSHGNELTLLYIAYLASKLATQAAAVLAASVTRSGDTAIRCKPTESARLRPFFFVASAFAAAAALELIASSALLLALTSSTTSSLLGPGCVLLLLCLGALLPMSIAAAAVAADEGCGALRAAWRLVSSRRGDAAVPALAASLLPVAAYPVYALAVEFARSNAAMNPAHAFDVGDSVWALGALSYVYLLPSVGVQLFSAVAVTVFYHRCREEHRRASTCHVPLEAVTVKP